MLRGVGGASERPRTQNGQKAAFDFADANTVHFNRNIFQPRTSRSYRKYRGSRGERGEIGGCVRGRCGVYSSYRSYVASVRAYVYVCVCVYVGKCTKAVLASTWHGIHARASRTISHEAVLGLHRGTIPAATVAPDLLLRLRNTFFVATSYLCSLP